jgi:hypothetical protein
MLASFFFGKHLDDEEEIMLVVHKHWLMGTKQLFWPTVIFIAFWSLLAFSHQRSVVLGILAASLCIAIWWIRNFMDYFLDAWVITNKGIIDLEWHGWFHRSSSRVLFSDLQGVSYEVNGILGTVLGYGSMEIEKISTGTTIEMEYVPRPRHVESAILEGMEHYMHKKNLKDATTVKDILAEFVAGTMQKRSVEEERSIRKK